MLYLIWCIATVPGDINAFTMDIKQCKDREGVMKSLLLLPVLLFLVGGCTTTYTHPAKSPMELEQDRLECEQIAQQSLAARGFENC